MKLIQVELPHEVAKQRDDLVQAGWFRNEDEAIRLALSKFVRHHRLELLERFQREDIEWMLKQKSMNER